MSEEYPDWQDREVKVVVNHEEQYSIWPADRENPAGWRDVGKKGMKAECLEYIKVVWTDMRPLSLRKKMEEDAAAEAAKNPHPQQRPASEPSTSMIDEDSKV